MQEMAKTVDIDHTGFSCGVLEEQGETLKFRGSMASQKRIDGREAEPNVQSYRHLPPVGESVSKTEKLQSDVQSLSALYRRASVSRYSFNSGRRLSNVRIGFSKSRKLLTLCSFGVLFLD